MATPAIEAWRDRRGTELRVEVEPGAIAQADALMPLHYRGGRPATIERVLAALDTEHDELAGVLVTSRPVLNGSWRRPAWGGRFCTGDRSADAAAINRDLRTISRVIVDPRYRGLGVGTRLVRAYLAAPDTPCTETITALGRTCPLFERAGMRAIVLPEPARNARLLAGLSARTPAEAARALLGLLDSRAEAALRAWARSSASTRRRADADTAELASLAVGALLAPPRAYAHG